MPSTRRPAAKPRRAAAEAPTDQRPDARLITAALDLAARQGWRRTSLGDIARAAGVPLDEAYVLFRTKPGILAGFTRQVNRTVLAGGEPSGTSREKLFELLMRRFDALKPHRPALRAIARDSIGDPATLCGLPLALNAMTWMLDGAGVSVAGLRGRARSLALLGAYAIVFQTFLNDDSEDLGRTMAALDRRLKASSFAGGREAGSAAHPVA